MERRGLRRAACALAGLGAIAACGTSVEPGTVRETRVVALDGRDAFRELPAAERLGFRSSRGAASTPSASTPEEPRLAWDTPEGWKVMPTSQFRVANFQIAGDPRAECYLTVLAGDGGGLKANVDRWRAQLGLGAAAEEELARAPRSRLFEMEAVRVDFSGSYTGMGGGEAREGWRLVGLLAIDPEGSAFLKMTGPADVLARELRAFERLASSFRVERAPRPAAEPTPQGSAPSASSDAPAAGAPAADRAGGLGWSLPAGWRRAPDDPSRLAGFYVDEGEGEGTPLVATLTVLAGDGGGLAANVARWRRQVGLPPPSEAELQGLPTIAMLGVGAKLVELEGEGGTRVLGAIGTLPASAVFVKLSGPDARVAAQRGAFLAFCESLEAR